MGRRAKRRMQVLTIPRGVFLIAGGQADQGEIEVRAAADHPDWGIVQSPFMRDNAKTLEFRHRISVTRNTLDYDETTVLAIYGKRFDHTDKNTLIRN